MKFLVEVRSVDLGEHLSGGDAVADVHRPFFDVAVGAGVQGGFLDGEDGCGQGDDHGGVIARDFLNNDLGYGLFRGFLFEVLLRPQSRDDAERKQKRGKQQGDAHDGGFGEKACAVFSGGEGEGQIFGIGGHGLVGKRSGLGQA